MQRRNRLSVKNYSPSTIFDLEAIQEQISRHRFRPDENIEGEGFVFAGKTPNLRNDPDFGEYLETQFVKVNKSEKLLYNETRLETPSVYRALVRVWKDTVEVHTYDEYLYRHILGMLGV